MDDIDKHSSRGWNFDGSERGNDHVAAINEHTQVGVLCCWRCFFSSVLFRSPLHKMARTHQTAKKSTDGEAPKKVIGASETKSTKRPRSELDGKAENTKSTKRRPRSELDGKAENTEKQASTPSINTPNWFNYITLEDG